ncbi:hypothetical protein PR202_gb11986 [Eleusine coracana subsp. coracana]|uniref:non-specific serine/threonine protein kinase n=1 Tax=Eleusine coracana subsp. coracana TaxID=191504 RepID=A0AAV5EPQ7_ELECO|nr:hypothetical protein PR202_gb11986 [Eleusine coracana subsp. coracana]
MSTSCACRPKSMATNNRAILPLQLLLFLALTALARAAAPCHPDDLRALRAFAANLIAAPTAWPSGDDDADCCAWPGVGCDADGRVTALRLPRVGPRGGPLPAAALAGLARPRGPRPQPQRPLRRPRPAPQLLDLSANRLAGALPSDSSSSSSASPPPCAATLRDLSLASNAFSGALPPALFRPRRPSKNLSLASNALAGQLTTRLRDLKNLTFLDFSGNAFSGHLPDVFADLTSLENLAAHSNNLSGPLPPSLSLLSSLRVLDLRNNSLSGPVSLVNFSAMPFLASVDLATNHFNGTLPVTLADCQELKSLSLAKNKLTGQLPEDYSRLASLSMLSLSNNSLHNISGALTVLRGCKNLTTLILTKNFDGEELPADGIAGFDAIEVLALGNCALRGRVPDWLTQCKKLEVLDLSWNRLVGTIPQWIGDFEYLSYLDLSNNSLVGEIPKSLTRLKSLVTASARQSQGIAFTSMPLYVKHNRSINGRQYNQLSNFPPSLFLNDNRLNGTIWPEFGNLRELHVLDLSNNSISGSIPDSLSRMDNLEVLDLSSNNLSGLIPSSLTDLTFLSKFSVAHNHLVGQIPNGGQFFTFSNTSFEGNPGLCRSTSCNLNLSLSRQASSGKKMQPSASVRNNKNKILGVAICVGLALAVLLTLILVNMSKRDVSAIDYEDTEGSCQELYDSYSKPVLFFQNSAVTELTGVVDLALVYKAYLPDGTKAAVKRLSGDCGQMEREFRAEVEALSQAQHKNLVTLRGYCRYGNDRLLIYSYMENGSLDYWLHERSDAGYMLKWESRLRIAQGSARGLAYLHKECEPNIIHRDVKSSNILLNENFDACLADFGLARLIQPYDTHVTTDLVGTLGYIPPEYSQSVIATPKGDVFSFGVVLLELLTGKRPVGCVKDEGIKGLGLLGSSYEI